MIRDHMKLWLLHPDFTIKHFGDLPELLDETDERSAVEQLGARWQPLKVPLEMVSVTKTVWCKPDAEDEKMKRGASPTYLTYPALRINGESYRLFGAIYLRHGLVMLYETGIVTIPGSAEIGRVTLTCGEGA